jgi:teichuronic acid biosynthesis glycosyltransferase TuaG
MKAAPLVSVVIPTHNRSGDLRFAMDSVLAQTMPDLELVVCDDGSSDDTADVVRTYARKDPRVIYAPDAPSGRPSIPRNRGIRLAQGMWVAFLDSDDRWAPNKLELQLAILTTAHATACCTAAYRVVDWAASLHQRLLPRHAAPTLRSLIARNTIVLSSVVASRASLLNAGGFPEDNNLTAIEDYALWLRLARLGPWTYLDAPLTYYHDMPASSIRAAAPRSEHLKMSRAFSDYLRWASANGYAVDVPTRITMTARLAAERIKDVIRARRGPAWP